MPAFSIPLSGLDADASDLSIIANDLANLNTVGYKSSTPQFSDLFYQQLGTTGSGDDIQVGAGVSLSSSPANFTEGSSSSTGVNTDVAIQGNGFFVLENGGQTEYTRAGNFTTNPQNQLIATDGSLVQGYPATNGVVNTSQPVGPLTIPEGQIIPPSATTNMQMNLNLNSQAAAGDTYSTGITVYDSQGAPHVLTATFTNVAANSWSYSISIPGADVGSTSAQKAITSGTLSFGSNGQLTSPSGAVTGIGISGLADGAATMGLTWNTTSSGQGLITQSATSSSATNTLTDGYPPGTLTNFNIASDGTIEGSYSNGQTRAVGQLALASFSNDEGLTRTGSNNFEATLGSGNASVGVANTGGRGTIQGGALELSNVDISTEFSELIIAQRAYEANAKTLTTFDQIAQDTLNIKQ